MYSTERKESAPNTKSVTLAPYYIYLISYCHLFLIDPCVERVGYTIHNRSYLIDDAEELYEEMWNFVNVDYEVGDNESVDDAVKSLIEVVTSHRNM